jgi:hypothetical protein
MPLVDGSQVMGACTCLRMLIGLWEGLLLAAVTQIGGQPTMLNELVCITSAALEGTLQMQSPECTYPDEPIVTELGFILFPTDLLWQWASSITRLHFGNALSLMEHYLDQLEADNDAGIRRVLHPQDKGMYARVLLFYICAHMCIYHYIVGTSSNGISFALILCHVRA